VMGTRYVVNFISGRIMKNIPKFPRSHRQIKQADYGETVSGRGGCLKKKTSKAVVAVKSITGLGVNLMARKERNTNLVHSCTVEMGD